MKGKKDPKKSKQGRPIKELLPAGFNKPARESLPLPVLDTTASQLVYEIQPAATCPNWPSDEAALSHDFGLNSSSYFEDDSEYVFPPSFYSFCNNGRFIWRLPDDLAPADSANRGNSRRLSCKKSILHTTTSKDQSRTIIEENDEDRPWSIVTFVERDETNEELEIRRQKEMEKFIASKKKGKPEEVHIGKVKEVKLGNIDLAKNVPLCSRWVASQLQLLKDKAWTHNGESIWNKIYPQKDGIPVYNPSGKYWVKMMLLGSYKMVEVDSRIPVFEGNILLPRSSNFRDLWPVILTKAYFKLYSFRWRNVHKFVTSPNQELDGSFIFSLTGLVPQYQFFDYIGGQEWEGLRLMLSDDNWEHNHNIISTYTRIDKDSAIHSASFIEEENSHKSIDENAGPRAKKQLNVIQGFSYLITDVFANSEDFDMRKILKKEKQRQEEDIKNALMKARVSSPARKLKRHQSPARIRELQKRKARRGKEKEERRQKLLETRQYPVYKLIRVKSGVAGVPPLNVDSGFSGLEIEDARLKMMNREYFLNKELEELERLMEAEDVELFDAKDSNEVDVARVLKEDRLEGVLFPKQRCQGGVWFSAEEFPNSLNEYFIYHEISHYAYRMVLDDLWKDKNLPYIHNQNFDVLLIDCNSADLINLVIAFAPSLPEGTLTSVDSTYLHLQKFDFEKEEVLHWAHEVRLATSSIVAHHYLIEAEHLVLRPLVANCPCGSVVWISSSVPISTMSRLQYLVDKVGWNQNKLNFDYSFLNKGYFYLPFKIEISSEDPSGVMIKVSSSDPNMLQFGKLILIDRDQGVNELSYKYLDIPTLETKRISFPPNSRGYRLLLVLFTPINLPEGTVTVDIVSKAADSIKATAGEMMDPVEYSDRYVPNKYGIIFKEQFFVPEEIHFSLHIRMRKGGLPVPGGKGKEIIPEEHLSSSHLLLFEIYDGDELIVSTKGFNQAIIPHLNLTTSSKELIMLCKYDIDEWPDCKLPSPELQDLNWVLRIISSDTIALIKDTRKEDKEEAIRKSWETAQPGRAEQAKQSRLRYLASMKASKNEDLTDHEKELIKESWQDRRKAKKELEAAGKGKVKAKEDKKQKEVEKPPVVEIEIPNPDDHVMIPIKKFLGHLQADRLRKVESNEPLLFTTSLIEQTKTKIKNEITSYNEVYAQKKQARAQQKAKLDATKETFKELVQWKKENIESSVQLYREARAEYQNKMEVKKK